MEELKKCTICREEKEYKFFDKDKEKKTGLSSCCKTCRKIKYYNKRGVEPPKIAKDGYKICNICKLEKTKSEYHKNKNGLRPTCKSCRKEETKIRYINSDKVKNREYNREYKKKNRDKMVKYRSDYYFKNKNKVPGFSKKVKSLIGMTFTGSGLHKCLKTESILGCSVLDFRKHIESQFLSWMSWENHGNISNGMEYNCSWDLDHIVPISLAKTEEEVYLLNHWSNFQPLCSKVNRSIKKNKYYKCSNIVKPEIMKMQEYLDETGIISY
jgi:hypothetical protein